MLRRLSLVDESIIFANDMRYENQNPQHVYLLEKIEELNKQLELAKQANHEFQALLETIYNALPWWKKLFLKFKI